MHGVMQILSVCFGIRGRCLNRSQLVSSMDCTFVSVLRGFVRILLYLLWPSTCRNPSFFRRCLNWLHAFLLFAYLMLELPQCCLTQLNELFWFLVCTLFSFLWEIVVVFLNSNVDEKMFSNLLNFLIVSCASSFPRKFPSTSDSYLNFS